MVTLQWALHSEPSFHYSSLEPELKHLQKDRAQAFFVPKILFEAGVGPELYGRCLDGEPSNAFPSEPNPILNKKNDSAINLTFAKSIFGQ